MSLYQLLGHPKKSEFLPTSEASLTKRACSKIPYTCNTYFGEQSQMLTLLNSPLTNYLFMHVRVCTCMYMYSIYIVNNRFSANIDKNIEAFLKEEIHLH